MSNQIDTNQDENLMNTAETQDVTAGETTNTESQESMAESTDSTVEAAEESTPVAEVKNSSNDEEVPVSVETVFQKPLVFGHARALGFHKP